MAKLKPSVEGFTGTGVLLNENPSLGVVVRLAPLV
jgi:hypothetical protein